MSKRTNQTARAVMKLAHSIKAQFTNFSAALKAAWAQIKQPAKTIVERLIEIGGKRWTKSETLDRIYFDAELVLKTIGYEWGSSKNSPHLTSWNNRDMSNNKFTKFLNEFRSDKFFYDVVKNEFNFSGWNSIKNEFLAKI